MKNVYRITKKKYTNVMTVKNIRAHVFLKIWLWENLRRKQMLLKRKLKKLENDICNIIFNI